MLKFVVLAVSGGWSVILCPHGVAYSVKFNLRSESPRDFTDLLLSWKHLPNISVYDFARGLATHGNLRKPSHIPFQPHEGRLADPNTDNLEAAKHNKLKVSLPWLTMKKASPDPNGHPVTGSSQHYVVYDKLHERNTKDPKDILRLIKIIPELQGWLNSQVAEQFFAEMRKNNYFLNNMAPSTHVLLMRSIVQHHNDKTNRQLLIRQLRHGSRAELTGNLTLSDLGQVVLGNQKC